MSPRQKNSWNQINQFHEKIFFWIFFIEKNTFTKWKIKKKFFFWWNWFIIYFISRVFLPGFLKKIWPTVLCTSFKNKYRLLSDFNHSFESTLQSKQISLNNYISCSGNLLHFTKKSQVPMVVKDRVPETFFCEIFGIFDDFSKWSMCQRRHTLKLWKKSSNNAKNLRKICAKFKKWWKFLLSFSSTIRLE